MAVEGVIFSRLQRLTHFVGDLGSNQLLVDEALNDLIEDFWQIFCFEVQGKATFRQSVLQQFHCLELWEVEKVGDSTAIRSRSS